MTTQELAQVEGPQNTGVAYEKGVAKGWDLISALLAGTEEMRRGGTKWLPKEPREQDDKYSIRRDRSFLYNAYKQSMTKIVSKPFSRKLTYVDFENLDKSLQKLDTDADGEGTSLHDFARRALYVSSSFGISMIMVHAPGRQHSETKLSVADIEKFGNDIYFEQIDPTNFLDFDYEIINGEKLLNYVRFIEYKIERDKDKRYIKSEYAYIHEYTLNIETNVGSYTKYRSNIAVDCDLYNKEFRIWNPRDKGTNNFDIVEELPYIGPGVGMGIPVIAFYTNKDAFFEATSLYQNLAETNLMHYQSQSDQRNILRFARVAQAYATGVTPEEMEKEIIQSTNNVVMLRNPDATLGYMEVSGESISAGQTDLDKIEQKMEQMGNQPFIERTGDSTATGVLVDESRQTTDIQAFIATEEIVLLECFRIAGEWIKRPVPESFLVEIYSDFTIQTAAVEEQRLVLEMYNDNILTPETTLNEAQRRRIISADVDIKQELENIKKRPNHLEAIADLVKMGVGVSISKRLENPGDFADEKNNLPQVAELPINNPNADSNNDDATNEGAEDG